MLLGSGCAEEHVIGTRGYAMVARIPVVQSVRRTGTTLLPAALLRGAQLAVADLDSDGNLDIAVAEGAAAQVCILAGTGRNQFEAPRCVASGLRDPATALQAVAVTSQGPRVLIAAGPDQLSLLRAERSANGFSVAAPVVTAAEAPGSHFASLAAADLAAVPLGPATSDGRQSLLVSDAGRDRVSVYPLLTAAGAQLGTPYHYPTGPRPGALLVTDVDEDRRPDLVTADLGDAGRGLAASISLIRAGGRITYGGCAPGLQTPYALAMAAPVSADSAPYLIVAEQATGRPPTAQRVSSEQPGFLTCAPTLSTALATALPAADAVLLGADLDGDGRSDLLHGSAQGLFLIPSRYQRAQQPADSLFVLSYPAAAMAAAVVAVRVADGDAAGGPELVVLTDDGSVTILENVFP